MAETEEQVYQPMDLGELLGQDSTVGKEEVTPSPKSEPVKEETKPEEEKESEVKPEDVKPEEKAPEKPEDVKVEEKPSFNWEVEDNPYKKRYWDTMQWDHKLNEENVDLKRNLEITQKKLDGTYVEEDTIAQAEAQQKEAQAEFKGKLTASNKIAIENYGQDYVTKMLYAPDAPFQQINNDPAVHFRVLHSEAPALEAIKILKELTFFNKYGRDVDKIESTIREKLKVEIKEEVTKEFKEKLKMKDKQPDGLGNVQDEKVPIKEQQGFQPKTTQQLFG